MNWEGLKPRNSMIETYIVVLAIHSAVSAIAYWVWGFEVALLALLVSGFANLAARAANRDALLEAVVHVQLKQPE